MNIVHKKLYAVYRSVKLWLILQQLFNPTLTCNWYVGSITFDVCYLRFIDCILLCIIWHLNISFIHSMATNYLNNILFHFIYTYVFEICQYLLLVVYRALAQKSSYLMRRGLKCVNIYTFLEWYRMIPSGTKWLRTLLLL